MSVKSFDVIPDGLIGRQFAEGNFIKFTAKGEMPNALIDAWKDIWSGDKLLNRRYTYDFEVYCQKSQLGENSEVEIYIATNNV